jgi:rhodanese-related sulfurtransferase
MLALAVGSLFLMQPKSTKQIQPDDLLWDIIQPTRYVTTDQVAKMIIGNDPTLELVDVRSAADYNKFTLPNALNVPLDSLLTSNAQRYFGIPGMRVVLFADDDIASDQAWVLLRRLGYKKNYVMKGGLNLWMNTIIRPPMPPETAPSTAFDQYHFRKGAQIYFTGAKPEISSAKKVNVVFKRKKKAKVAAGGC